MYSRILSLLFSCHRIPSRSFFYKGKQFPICARCTGIFIGFIIGIIYIILSLFIQSIQIPMNYIILLFFIPTALDGGIQLYTKYESNNIKRLITGILTGIGIIFVIAFTVQLSRSHAIWVFNQLNK